MKNGENSDNSGRVRLTTSISWRPEDLEIAKEAAKARGLSLSAWLRQLILSSEEYQAVQAHANSDLSDAKYEKAAKLLVVQALDLENWSEVEQWYTEQARQELLKQYIMRLRGQDAAKVTEILKRAEDLSALEEMEGTSDPKPQKKKQA